MRKKNPPLNSLRAFEAVARHLSIVKAAEELHVTHSAVSQQVKLLEDYLGIKLLDRHGAKIKLLDIGKQYAADLGNAFRMIAQATSQILASDNNILTINLLSTFAMRWLIPRLQEFQDQFPEFEIRLSTPSKVVDFKTESIDLAIYYGEGDWADLHIDFLFNEYLQPVCSPRLMKKKKLTITQMLEQHKLIYVKTEERKNAWQLWLSTMGLTEPKQANRIYFQNSVQALEAAINGLGVAMAPELFVQEDIAANRLLVLSTQKVQAPYSFYLVFPESYLNRYKVTCFRDWILHQCELLPKRFIT